MFEKNRAHENVCPFLGLRLDMETRYGFPNPGNHCHRENNPRAINLDYQQNVCLSHNYLTCPIYLKMNNRSTEGMLIQADRVPKIAANGAGASSSGWMRLSLGLVLVVGSLIGMYFLSRGNPLGSDNRQNGGTIATTQPSEGIIDRLTDTPMAGTATLSSTALGSEITSTPFLTSTATATVTSTPTASPTSSETATPSLTFTATSPPNFPPPPTNTPQPTLTYTPLPSLTATAIPPSNTPVPPTNTPIPPSNTPISDDPTATPIPPTSTPISDDPTATP